MKGREGGKLEIGTLVGQQHLQKKNKMREMWRGRKRGEGETREREGKTKRGKQRTEKEWIKGKKGGNVKVKKQDDKR